MILIFDTETTGLPKFDNVPLNEFDNWPRVVQVAWQLHADDGKLISHGERIVYPDGYEIPYNAVKVHGISTEMAREKGLPVDDVLLEFIQVLDQCRVMAGHNLQFDLNILGSEYLRAGFENPFTNIPVIDTKEESTDFCQLRGSKGGKYKWPTLTELHQKLFHRPFDAAHNAIWDVEATARCFFMLAELKIIKSPFVNPNSRPTQYFDETALRVLPSPENEQSAPIKLEIEQPVENQKASLPSSEPEPSLEVISNDEALQYPFVHLHCRSHYSVLQAFGDEEEYVKAALKLGMKALSITDMGNISCAIYFQDAAAKKDPNFKAIIGMEINVCDDHTDRSRKDNGHPVVLLAKNLEGYKNLCMLTSIAQIDGYYYLPRIDKNLLSRYKSGLVAISAHMNGEISHLLLNAGMQPATEALSWWTENFGDDFYLEICNHGLEDEIILNRSIQKLCSQTGAKPVATNNTFYVNADDHDLHDIAICVREGEQKNTPIGRGRGNRYGLESREYYLKSGKEMYALFADSMPEALENTIKISESIEPFSIKVKQPVIPQFEIPEGYENEDNYLRTLAYAGARERFGEFGDEVNDRLSYELKILIDKKFAAYFLIVADFIAKAREMGVRVGPGRGSAAGSLVAYCLKITDIDPLKYDLLFERFLNPERASMPDVDIDFDNIGREKVLDYVTKKYGADRVAQIVTFGTMKAKSAIKDVARVLDLPIAESEALTKLFPKADVKLKDLLSKDLSHAIFKDKITTDEVENVNKLKAIAATDKLDGKVLQYAARMEGTLRNNGVHACGVIIAPEPVQNLAPIMRQKESALPVTQYDNDMVEPAGLLKMDFLGLKTLNIMEDALEIIEQRHRLKIDIDNLPLDDKLTYEVFQRGDTSALFQFESAGMQKHLRTLKPDRLEDLIAMNALYRPGPLAYIPQFIKRKHGEASIKYDHPLMEEILEPTYGITVYQEQVMRLSQKLAGFSLAEADSLRKAMGKKKKEELDKNYEKFVNGCLANGITDETIKKIWHDWVEFANYAFNKSHATCYAYLAYQTAYLKANYPVEFMAAQLNNTDGIDGLKTYMDEAKKIGLTVLGPDINESFTKFTVNSRGEIRLGLSAIKNVGEGAADEIIQVRQAGGPFLNIFDLCKRANSRVLNKRVMEALAYTGAFDCFKGIHRAQYFHKAEGENFTTLEKALKFGAQAQAAESANQASLFGESDSTRLPEPKIPACEEWSLIERLKKEKEFLGLYLSGHPLDNFSFQLNTICKHELSHIADMNAAKGKEFTLGGIITKARTGISKSGNPYAFIKVEDFTHGIEFGFFGNDYINFNAFFQEGLAVYMRIRVQKREYPKDSNELEYKILEMKLMSDLARDKLREMSIKVLASDINDEFIKMMRETLTHKKDGWMSLRINLLDELNQREISMVSRDHKIDLNQDLWQKLRTMDMKVTYN